MTKNKLTEERIIKAHNKIAGLLIIAITTFIACIIAISASLILWQQNIFYVLGAWFVATVTVFIASRKDVKIVLKTWKD